MYGDPLEAIYRVYINWGVSKILGILESEKASKNGNFRGISSRKGSISVCNALLHLAILRLIHHFGHLSVRINELHYS